MRGFCRKKIDYAAFVPTVDGNRSKAEIRMMFLWPENGEPMLVNNLVRMSQDAMMAVKFNKNNTWVGLQHRVARGLIKALGKRRALGRVSPIGPQPARFADVHRRGAISIHDMRIGDFLRLPGTAFAA